MTCLAISPFTMPAALYKADEVLGYQEWVGNPSNTEQAEFLSSFRRRAELASTMAEVKSHATHEPTLHAEWLRAQGWESQLAASAVPGELLLAGTLDIIGKWQQPGIPYRADRFDRVTLKHGVYTSYPAPGEHPVVEVLTQNEGYNFCFQQVDKAPKTAAELAAIALDMASRHADTLVELDFPMVDLRAQSDASYMVGIHSGKNVIGQAAEQFRLELNEIGGRASAAAEIVTRGGLERIRLEGPFVVCVNRNDAPSDGDKVAFAAYCDRSVWRRPAEGRIK